MATITDIVNDLVTLTDAGTLTWVLTGANSHYQYYNALTVSTLDIYFHWSINNNSTSNPTGLKLSQSGTTISDSLADLTPIWLVLKADTLADLNAIEQAVLDAYYAELSAL